MGLCGPTGSLFCTLISAFGALFMGALAILLGRDYPYLGEWYMLETKGGPKPMPYPEQRDKAVHGAWLICIVYAALAFFCGFIFSYHSFRSPGYQKVNS